MNILLPLPNLLRQALYLILSIQDFKLLMENPKDIYCFWTNQWTQVISNLMSTTYQHLLYLYITNELLEITYTACNFYFLVTRQTSF